MVGGGTGATINTLVLTKTLTKNERKVFNEAFKSLGECCFPLLVRSVEKKKRLCARWGLEKKVKSSLNVRTV